MTATSGSSTRTSGAVLVVAILIAVLALTFLASDVTKKMSLNQTMRTFALVEERYDVEVVSEAADYSLGFRFEDVRINTGEKTMTCLVVRESNTTASATCNEPLKEK